MGIDNISQEQLTQHIIRRLIDSKDLIFSQWVMPVGTNTRHFYLDDFFESNICRKIYEGFPRDGNGFFDRESFREKKRTSADLAEYDRILSNVTYAFQDPRVVKLVGDIVGFGDLEPDPKLYAGGLSMMFRGDFLNPHLDNSHDMTRDRYRRLNLLYYVSPEWELEFGGNFELWDQKREIPKTIMAKTNRLVVMETNKNSWHSVSKVNVDSPRCCVSNYYFSKESPDGSDYFHVTSFTGRPDEKSKRLLGSFDNFLRNFISKKLKVGRGKSLINKKKT